VDRAHKIDPAKRPNIQEIINFQTAMKAAEQLRGGDFHKGSCY